MLFHKNKFVLKIRHGRGEAYTTNLRGVISHFIVAPDRDDVIWNLKVLDSDNDVILQVKDHIGRLDYKEGIVVGKSKEEALRLLFSEVSYNIPFQIIFIVQEKI